MVAPHNLFLVLLGYLMLLFALAHFAEQKEKAGRSIINNPYVFSLSLAVYCTSWTFYGSVGRAATSGLSFLTIYLGPTVMAALWALVLKKVVRIAKANRITTISDFIGSRYGKSPILSALVTIIAVAGITPYIGLQIKAIMSTFTIISGDIKGSDMEGLVITIILGVFAVMFGARRLDSAERHGGLVFAVAFESIVKLFAFILIGVFVTFGLFSGIGDVFSRIENAGYAHLLVMEGGQDYFEWGALLFLSMTAILFLPRQFQMAVVENYDEGHIAKAAWLFPLYLLLMNVFVLPIAFGGILLTGSEQGADYFVLTLPLQQGAKYLSLVAFIGGFSAATAMVIVESLALSVMVLNSIVLPFLISFEDVELQSLGSNLKAMILNIKRVVVILIVFLGYLFAVSIGEFYSLVDIGLKSFEAVSLFAPAFFLGLYWKRASKKGAVAGLLAGFAVWFYTLIVPAMIKAGLMDQTGVIARMTTIGWLDPDHLFGLTGLGKWGHSLFWSFFINLALLVGISVWTRQSREEEIQALIFVESYEQVKELTHSGSYTVGDVEDILTEYLGKAEADRVIQAFLATGDRRRDRLSSRDLYELRSEAEKVLSGALGTSMAAIILKNKLVLTERERGELSESIKHITESLRLSRKELAEANRELSYMKEFSENIIESAPVGIVTIDDSLRVKSWNRHMENITGLKRPETIDRSLLSVLPWMPRDLPSQSEQREFTFQAPGRQMFQISISPFKDPSGGFVVTVADITEKKKMEEQLLQSSKLASIGKLTAGISHEIGNPLASISSLVQEMNALDNESKGYGEFRIESLSTINSHVERIARIVRSLGDFARVSSAEKRLAHVSEIIDHTLDLIKYDKRFKKVRFTKTTADVPLVMVNRDQIQQVFLNLFLNSLDAMPDGGRLDVVTGSRDGVVEVSINDSGAGIDESIADRVFDPFFTTKPLGRGTGLGLSICYGIMREHGGTISLMSRKGEGSTFVVTLPVHSRADG